MEQRTVRRYQTFGEKAGDSNSAAKLRALKLHRLGQDEEQPLAGMSVLDIGCNEGFFCDAVRDLGAANVLGIDRSSGHIELAKQRSPDIRFMAGTWWDIPEEKFDVILFLSAIHYEPEQRRLLDKLATHLNPRGTLVLECGVAPEARNTIAWRHVYRSRKDRPLRFPTRALLERELLASFSVRAVSNSVPQSGDPVPRTVFHCRLRRPMAILISGPPMAGKTIVGDALDNRGIPVYRVDSLLYRLTRAPVYRKHPLAEALVALVGDPPAKHPRWAKVVSDLVEQGHGAELGSVIAEECPLEADVFAVEGDAMRHEPVLQSLIAALSKRGCRIWHMQRSR